MINRHFLRAKVLQTLYEYYISSSNNVENAEKKLFESINNLYYMEVAFLSIIIELKDIELKIQDESKNKFFPTSQDLNPNLNFVNNKLILQLEKNKELQKAIEKKRINWIEYHALFFKLLAEFKGTETYKNYMSKAEHTYNEDRNFVIKLFKNSIMQYKPLTDVLFEKEIEWEADYLFVAEYFIKFLKEYKEDDTPDKHLIRPFVKEAGKNNESKKEDNENDEEFVSCLFRNTVKMYDEFDAIIQKRLENWDRERLAFMDTVIIKMGMTEIVFCKTVPIRVTLNEYIELAREFSTRKSKLFVNGMLDRLIVELRSRGMIQKEGRGLGEMEKYTNIE
jgi:N utilization substance protein B